MTIQRRTVAYSVGSTDFEAEAVWDDAVAGQRPGVLIAPSFMDLSDLERREAERLAGMGYAALAMDLFGTKVNPGTADEAKEAMGALNADRPEVARRMAAALEQLRAMPEVDGGRVAASGYCFGGKCVLDLARTGAEIAGVATFHGVLDAPEPEAAERIVAKILVLHGWADPMGTPQLVLTFADEMDRRGADWELVAYGHTVHGFTNPGRPDMYRKEADVRSHARFDAFLRELFPA